MNTQSGNAGKDTPGVAPTVISKITHQLTTLDVVAGGVDIVGAANVGTEDTFSYTLTDKNNSSVTAGFAIELLPEVALIHNLATKSYAGGGGSDSIFGNGNADTLSGGAGITGGGITGSARCSPG